MKKLQKSLLKLPSLLAGVLLPFTAGIAQAEVLFTDGDFDLQTQGQTVGAPWGPVGGGNLVTDAAQSPFDNVYPLNAKGANFPATAGNPYIVRSTTAPIPATATGKLYFNLDFRNNTDEPGDYSIVITANASGAARSVALYVSGTALYADSSSGSEQVATLEIGKWYNLQLTLDLDTKTYSGSLASHTDRTAIPDRAFVNASQPINGVYSDGGTSFVPGTAPDHDVDNWALSDTPLAALTGGAYVQSTSPSGSAVSNKAPIVIELVDSTTTVAPNSIQLFLNDQPITPTVAKTDQTTTVRYVSPTDFRPGVYNVRLVFGDNSTPQVVKESQFSFTVPGPSITSFGPTGEGNKANAPVSIEITDMNSKVAQDSIKLYLNDQLVTPTVNKPTGNPVTTVTFAPEGGFALGSSNNVRVVFSDDSAPAIETTKSFSFKVVESAIAGSVINIDFDGFRNVPGPDVQGPAYQGVGAAGGGKVFNSIAAPSKLEDGTDDDMLTVGRENLMNSLGDPTSIGFTVSPMGGDVGGAPTTDPTSPAALFSDYIFNNSAGNLAGESPWTISGLTDVPYVDLYFYRSSGGITIPGVSATPITDRGIFTSANTVYFSRAPVVNGSVTGTFGSGTAVINGMTIVKPLPQPFVKSISPQGPGVTPQTPITIELEDYVTQVNPASIQLLLNGTAATPTVNKPAGSTVTTITYSPAGGFAQGATYNGTLIFSDNANPAVFQTNQFSFTILSEASAALTVNIDINGARNVPGPRGPGPTYSGVGPGGGGSSWNGILADSRLEDGTDEDNLTVGAENLINSLGGATTIDFTISPVGGDAGGASPATDPASPAALLGDYLFVGSAGQVSGLAEFTISGLGDTPFVDLYFIYGANGTITPPGGPAAPFAGAGIFTPGNTMFFRKVPVENGTIVGTIGNGAAATLIYGLTIQKPLPQPFLLSVSPNAAPQARLRTNDIGVITLQLQDYVSKVVPGSIELTLNNQPASPQITTDATKGTTTISYDSFGKLQLDSTNTVRLIFADDATPSLKQTNEFSFYVVSEETIGRIVNVDFNGVRNVPGPDEPGPTYSGVGPAGGGTVFNGISADSRIEGGDDDNITVGAQNLVNSFGVATSVGFTVSPVGGDVGGAPTTEPTATEALLSDYIFNNSAGNTAGQSPFTISGLGTAATADLYFFKGPGSITIPGATAAAFAGSGIFTPANTVYFPAVPVVDGKIEGSFGGGVTVIHGFTIAWSAPSTTVGEININRDGNNITVTWIGAGVLQSASEINGNWSDVEGATNPYPVTPAAGAGHRFYRLKK